MFSRRTSWDRTTNALTLMVTEARTTGRTLIDLTESNPTRVHLFDAAPLLAELGHPRGTAYEPAPLGHPAARAAVAGYYAARGMQVDADRVVLSASTSEAYSWIFSVLADPDDAVLLPRPSYPLLQWIGQSQGVRLPTYGLARDADFRLDLDDLRRRIDERTRAIVLVHPNNPTGTFVRRSETEALLRLAKEHDLALIVDEVFGDYAFGSAPRDRLPSFVEVEREGPLVFVLSGLSKILLLPQLKLGWTVVHGPAPLVEESLARLELVADTYLSVGTPVQLALPALLRWQPQIQRGVLARLEANLAALDAELAALGPIAPVRRLAVHGGWYAVLEVPRTRDEDAWVELVLREDGVIVHPGYFFDFDREGFLVVSLLPLEDAFRGAIRRVLRRVADG